MKVTCVSIAQVIFMYILSLDGLKYEVRQKKIK
jgi:hypothetical protein